MTNFIPIFPLGIVVYPGESLNLHIFEPRYRQLIKECIENKKPFGIPSVIENNLMEFGTLVEVTALKQEYDDGKMDINTKGLRVFRILEVVKDLPEKMYSGAIVNYPGSESFFISPQMPFITASIRQLHAMIQVEKTFPKPDELLTSYDVAHLAGLNLQEEYEVLQLQFEEQRVEYLRRHLQKVLPVAKEMEALRNKIKLNGHFRELKGLGFE